MARALAESGQWQVPTLVNERRWFLGAPGQRSGDATQYLPPSAREAWTQRLERGEVTYTGDAASLHQGWKATLQVVRVLAESGVGFLAGTDFGQPFVAPGLALHEELELLVAAGLTPLQALQAATLEPARALGVSDSRGAVAPGKVADLVLLEANPLEAIGNTRRIQAVVLTGRYLGREALDALLEEAPARSELWDRS